MKSGGWRRDSILSNAVEAIIGAIYLDSDVESCREIVLDLYENLISDIIVDKFEKDAKTELQEYLQARKQSLPVYTVISETGEAHSRKFTVACEIDGLEQRFMATGRSKRIAEQLAAGKALEALVNNDS